MCLFQLHNEQCILFRCQHLPDSQRQFIIIWRADHLNPGPLYRGQKLYVSSANWATGRPSQAVFQYNTREIGPD